MTNNIKKQLFSGVFYTALAKYSGVLISLVVAGILARLLSPDDFGIVAVATVIIAFFNLLTDMGVSPAIIQHKSLTKDDLSDIFSFTIWTGIGISVLFFASSWIIAHSEPAFLSFDEDDVPVLPNTFHVAKPSGGIFFAGKIHIRTRDECIIIFSSRYQQTVPPRTVQIKMSSPKAAAFAIVAIQIAKCVGDTDNMSFLVAL